MQLIRRVGRKTVANRIYGLTLKIAERCNLDCTYCYMYHHEDKSYLLRPKIMSDRVFDQVIARVREYCSHHAPHKISLSMHGGEPTLIGPDRLDRLLARARHALGDHLDGIWMQTNAVLIDERWIDVLSRHGMKVGVSLDGPPHVHDVARVDHAGRGSHAKTVRGIRLLQAGGVFGGVLCVIQPGAPSLEIYRYFRSLGITSINFLLPDATHDSKPTLFKSADPAPVADYLTPIFDRWLEEDDPKIRVRPFWQLIAAMKGRHIGTDAFGNPPLGYLMIETDGSIQSLDALKICTERVEETGLNVFEHGLDDLELGPPLFRRWLRSGVPLCRTCRVCPERSVCGGGYLPHRYSLAGGFNNPSIWCKDILILLAHIRGRLENTLAA